MASRLFAKADPAQLEQKRQEFFEESRLGATRQRYGLFSFTGTLAISKSNYDGARPNRRDTDGNVITAPRNLTSSPTKHGKAADVYFSPPAFVTIGDPYRDPLKPQRQERVRAEKSRQIHGAPFKSPGPTRHTYSLEYVPEGATPRIIKKDAEGGVYFGPRNFYTSPPKKGNPANTPNTALGAVPEYIEEREQPRRVSPKLSIHERSFRGAGSTSGVFADNQTTYGTENLPPKSPRKTYKPTPLQHERPFLYPGGLKSGKEYAVFSPFPEHMPTPPPKVLRRAPAETNPFKLPNAFGDTPSPSIVSMNLRTEFKRR